MRALSSPSATVGTVAILFTSIVGCGSDSGASRSADPEELFEQGPFEVGFREITITYSAAASMEDRELVLRVWYPAQSDSGEPPAEYSVAGIGLLAEHALDAPPATDQEGLPFVVHSHGNAGESLLQAPAIGSIVDDTFGKLEVPTMLMSGLLDQTTTHEEHAEPAWKGLDHPDDLWVEMPKGAHFTFITICHDLTEEQLAFGRRHVLDETEWDAILTGPPLGNPGDFVVTVK